MTWGPLACDPAKKGEAMEFCAKSLCELWLFVAGEESLGKLKSFSVVPYDMEIRWELFCWKRVEVLEEVEKGSLSWKVLYRRSSREIYLLEQAKVLKGALFVGCLPLTKFKCCAQASGYPFDD